jgi:hypothetical protein
MCKGLDRFGFGFGVWMWCRRKHAIVEGEEVKR